MNNPKTDNYHELIKLTNNEKLREMERVLPRFCTHFFVGIRDRVSTRTRVGYAYDLQVFFRYINDYVFPTPYEKIADIPLDAMEKIEKFDIENYMEYLTWYEGPDGVQHHNEERGKSRKLSALKSLYTYLCESELIKLNPAALVRMPKLHEKNIIRLDPAEVAKLLDTIENGSDQESGHQRKYHQRTAIRDLALITLLLGTGIRVSECVGLNLTDVDFDNGAIRIIRKGGNEATVYFGEEAEEALSAYIDERKKIIPISGHENALFLSIQNRRITVRAVENLVKKYASEVTTLKKITPHKLRSTYGTALYRESGDIYLVASVLGHKDVNTTRKHYASSNEEKKRLAANMVKLRKDE